MLKYCMLDMDGVITDFVGGVCKVHGNKNPYLDPRNNGVFEVEKIWGISAEDFWKPTQVDGFWEGLDKTHDADKIVDVVLQYFHPEQVCILTAPSHDPRCIPGKRAWIEKHYPQFKKNMLFGAAKRFLAGPDRILIDDRTENAINFFRADGKAILVPRPWNGEYLDSDKSSSVVYSRLSFEFALSNLKD